MKLSKTTIIKLFINDSNCCAIIQQLGVIFGGVIIIFLEFGFVFQNKYDFNPLICGILFSSVGFCLHIGVVIAYICSSCVFEPLCVIRICVIWFALSSFWFIIPFFIGQSGFPSYYLYVILCIHI